MAVSRSQGPEKKEEKPCGEWDKAGSACCVPDFVPAAVPRWAYLHCIDQKTKL